MTSKLNIEFLSIIAYLRILLILIIIIRYLLIFDYDFVHFIYMYIVVFFYLCITLLMYILCTRLFTFIIMCLALKIRKFVLYFKFYFACIFPKHSYFPRIVFFIIRVVNRFHVIINFKPLYIELC